jgi:hypothetical protein
MFNQYPESKDFSKTLLPCMADKRTYKSILASTTNNLAIIKIPTKQFKNNPSLLFGAESTISGYITFEQGAAATNDPYFTFLDCNIYTLFSSVKVLYGTQVLSYINNYAQYMQSKSDMNSSSLSKYNNSITLASLEPTTFTTIPTITTNTIVPDANAPATISNDQVFQNAGFNVAQLGCTATFNIDISSPLTASVPFSFNLQNIIGDALDNALPLHLLTNNDLIIEIELNNCATCQVCNNTDNAFKSISINELQYNAIISHIPQSVSNILYPNNTARIIGTDVKNDNKQITHNQNYLNLQYDNFKFRYVNAIIFFMQNIASNNNTLKVSISQRTGGGVYDYHIMYKNQRYPNRPINNTAEMFTQTQKCFNSTSSCITYTNYVQSNTASDPDDIFDPASAYVRAPLYTNVKKFVGGIPLVRYYSNDKHFKGVDFSESEITLNLELNKVSFLPTGQKVLRAYPTTPSANGGIVLRTYCMYDVIYEISNGDIKVIY